MKIGLVGCTHGELDQIYQTAQKLECNRNIKIDVIVCCGDFQATRNESDLRCMAIPEKFHDMGSFYKYYSGEKIAPFLTILIGGNHEASNYLQELPFGGWVAPKIYYLGYAGVINLGDLRIGGLSGIFKAPDYMKGHFEKAPYTESTKRSVYHIRNVEVFRLKQISGKLDVMLSHDWPRGVYNYGSIETLIKNKPFFEKQVSENVLGNEPCEELLFHLKPKYWFSAHLHTKFSALVPHKSENESESEKESESTKFLALDKCLPNRKYFEVIDFPDSNGTIEDLSYDLEWLTILFLTDHLTSSKWSRQYMPGPKSGERWKFTPTEEEKKFVLEKMGGNLRIPTEFVLTSPIYQGSHSRHGIQQSYATLNPQTIEFCQRLGIKDPLSELVEKCSISLQEDYSPFSTPEKHQNSTYLSFNNSSRSNISRSSFSQRMSNINSSINSGSTVEDSFVNSPHSTSVRYSLGSQLSSLEPEWRAQCTSTPDSALKKRKFNFPSFKEKSEEDSPASNILPFEIDRCGSTPNETPNSGKKQFRRRNGNIYQEEHD